MPTVRIAQAQINPTVGDLKGNIAKAAIALGRARELKADVVTFPELNVCGYPPEDLLLRPHFISDNISAVDEIVKQTAGLTVVVGFADFKSGKIYNAAALIHDGAIKGVYHKIELPNYGVFDERRYFTPGSGCLGFMLKGVRFSLSICEDIWVLNGGSAKCAAALGAHVVLNISASPFHAGKTSERRKVVSDFAKKTGAFVCYNNLVGGQDELVFDGGGLICDPKGNVVAKSKRFAEDFLVVDIDVARTSSKKGRGESEKSMVMLESPESELAKPPVQIANVHELDEVEEIFEALVLGTRDYLNKNSFEKAALGLSGGIDSALTAAIAVAALGAGNVIGVTMPSMHSSKETRSDAEKLAENLNIRLITTPIVDIYKTYVGSLAEAFGPGDPGVELENLQARIRGNILMALSNRFGWLVLTTGNKSETATGYCTLYGDMAGGFAVIKDVPKTVVYKLSHLVNKRAGREVIPASIIERPPTAELRPNQKDEDSLPPYDVLDPIIHEYVEEDRSLDEIVEKGIPRQLARDVLRMIDRSEYKRRQAPPGVKITPKAFGRDRRMPITNRSGH